MLKRVADISIVAAMVMVPVFAWGASFDCANALTRQEKIICSSAELSSADEDLAKAYKKALAATKNKADLKLQQKDWLKQRGQATDAVTMLQFYQRRIAQLSADDTTAPNTTVLQVEDPASGVWLASQSAQIQLGVWDKEGDKSPRAGGFDATFIVTAPDAKTYSLRKHSATGTDWVNCFFPEEFEDYPSMDGQYLKYSWKCLIGTSQVGGGEFYWGHDRASSNIFKP